MNVATFFIAAVLFLTTAVILYFIWYAVRGRHSIERRRRQAEARRRKTEREDNTKVRWGVDKHSYCYPKINDTMGYEFITVEKIPEDLRTHVPIDNPVETTPADSWKYDASQGFTNVTAARATAATDDQPGKTDEEDISYPQMDQKDPYRFGSIKRKNNEERLPESQLEDEDLQDDEETGDAINPQDIEDLRNMKEWFNKDVDNLPSDEDLIAMMEEHPEAIDPNEPDRETVRQFIKEREELEKEAMEFEQAAFEASDNNSHSSFGSDIMNELAESLEDDNEQPAEPQPQIDTENIPDPND